MSPLLPTPLLVLAVVVAFGLAVPSTRRPTSALRLTTELFAIGPAHGAGLAAGWAPRVPSV